MRRTTTTTDTTDAPVAQGADTTGFAAAYRSLVEAFFRHDDLRRDPERVHELSMASKDLERARHEMLSMRTQHTR